MDSKEELFNVYNRLMKIKSQCSCKLIDELNMSELTIKQIEYIKKFDEYECITISRLAENLDLSKPSITEMIKKFIKMDCVYKKQCEMDGRVQYIHLTEKGKQIARFEELELRSLVDRITISLDEDEINILIKLLSKVE